MKASVGLIIYLLLLTEAWLQSYSWSRCQMVRAGYIAECDGVSSMSDVQPEYKRSMGVSVVITGTSSGYME